MPEDNKVILLGIPVVPMTIHEVLDSMLEMAKAGFQGECRVLATVNVDFLVNALSMSDSRPLNAPLVKVLRKSPLITADGMPLVLLARLLGTPLPERVAGSDILPMFAERAAAMGTRLYFLGGTPENANAAATILRERYPGLRIVGIDSPFVKLDDTPENLANDQAICARINAAEPDIVFAGFSNPKQELWLGKNAQNIHAAAAIGVGGTFNFICGAVKRAPRWMQRGGLEWIYRIMQEPGRLWKRYGWGLIKFNFIVLQCGGGNLLGKLFGRASESSWNPVAPAERDGALELDCTGLSRVDNPARIRILEAHLEAYRRGLPLHFVHLSFFARLQLKGHRLFF